MIDRSLLHSPELDARPTAGDEGDSSSRSASAIAARQTKPFHCAHRWSFFGWVTLTSGFILIVHPLMDAFGPGTLGAPLVYACFGAVAAGAAMIAIGGVLGQGAFSARMCRSFELVLIFTAFWLAGSLWQRNSHGTGFDYDWETRAMVFLCLPLVFLAIQSPLWLVRLAFHWQIVPAELSDQPIRQPLSIRDMLAGTCLIALAFAAARAAMAIALEGEVISAVAFWGLLGGWMVCSAGISLAGTIPVVATTLRAKHPRQALAGLALYVTAVLAVMYVVLATTIRLRFWDALGIAIMVATFIAMLTVPLLIVRGFGYRLRKGRDLVMQSMTANSARPDPFQ